MDDAQNPDCGFLSGCGRGNRRACCSGDGNPFLSWLAFGKSIGIPADSPAVLDLSVIKLAFGFEVGVTVAHILCFIGAFVGYKYTVKRMRLGERDEYEKGE